MTTLRFSDVFDKQSRRLLQITFRANCRALGIEKESFCVSLQRAPMPATAAGACAPDMAAVRDFYMFMNLDQDLAQSIFTLGHELVHVRQYLRGQLTPTPSILGTTWMGQLYPSTFVVDDKNYRSLPWEQEAFSLHNFLYRDAVNSLGYQDAVSLLRDLLVREGVPEEAIRELEDAKAAA